jgi:hypothetical protein
MVAGVWLAFIGWFIFTAAHADEAQVLTRTALAGVRVGDAMTPHPRTAPAWLTVQDFIERYLLGDRHSAYPVEDHNGSISGLITLIQLRQVEPSSRAATLIGEIAIPLSRVPIALPDEPVTALLERLASAQSSRASLSTPGVSSASSLRAISLGWSTCTGSPRPPSLTDTDAPRGDDRTRRKL